MTTESYKAPGERARKNFSAIYQRLSSVGQVNVAKALDISEPTMSRLAEQSERIARMLEALGLKVVPVEMKCYDPKVIQAILTLAQCQLGNATDVEKLQWEDHE